LAVYEPILVPKPVHNDNVSVNERKVLSIVTQNIIKALPHAIGKYRPRDLERLVPNGQQPRHATGGQGRELAAVQPQ
jgi:hypothetical protein